MLAEQTSRGGIDRAKATERPEVPEVACCAAVCPCHGWTRRTEQLLRQARLPSRPATGPALGTVQRGQPPLFSGKGLQSLAIASDVERSDRSGNI